jgi:hypothetical protein
MHVVHTEGVPPNQGRMNFPRMSWVQKRRKALRNTVKENCMAASGNLGCAGAFTAVIIDFS